MKLILMMLGVALAATSLASPGRSKLWGFDADRTAELPQGFSSEVGEWKVVVDESAPSKPNVLAQLAKSPGSAFNLTLVSDTSFTDVRLSVMMKAVAGSEDQGGGVVWRARDAKNYYIARWNPLENNFRVYKVVDGRRTQLDGASLDAPPAWHALEVEMVGSHIECSFDGRKYLDVKDSTFAEGGRIGLWTKSDAQTHFDELKAEPAGQGRGDEKEDDDDD